MNTVTINGVTAELETKNWESGAFSRVYLKNLFEFTGIEYGTHNSGRISRAYSPLEKLSNAEAEAIRAVLNNSFVQNGELHYDEPSKGVGFTRRFIEAAKADILEAVAS